MTKGVSVIIIIISIILILGGLALIGAFCYEEFDNKNHKQVHVYYVAIGVLLLLIGIAGTILYFVKYKKDAKIKVTPEGESQEDKLIMLPPEPAPKMEMPVQQMPQPPMMGMTRPMTPTFQGYQSYPNIYSPPGYMPNPMMRYGM